MEVKYEELRLRVKSKIEQKCLLRNVDLPGKYGSKYTWMFYMRPGLFDSEFLRDIGEMFLYRVNQEIGNFDFQICGLETGAVPLVVGLPLVASLRDIKINAFSVRKEQKEYGLRNWLEGSPTNQKFLIVDDIANSTSSMRKCMDIAKNQGLEFSGFAFSILRKKNENPDPNRHMPSDTRFIHLYEIQEFGL